MPWANARRRRGRTPGLMPNVAAYGPDGIALMREGLSAAQALERLVAADDGRDQRQVRAGRRPRRRRRLHRRLLPRTGLAIRPAPASPARAISRRGPRRPCRQRDVRRQGPARLPTGCSRRSRPATAGGDRRGRQSAALYVARHEGGYLGANDVFVDLRVDDAAQPVQELRHLPDAARSLSRRQRARGRIAIDQSLLCELQEIMRRRGHYRGAIRGAWDEATERALMEFVGTEEPRRARRYEGPHDRRPRRSPSCEDVRHELGQARRRSRRGGDGGRGGSSA